MTFKTTHAAIALGLFLGAAQAGAVTITFDELAEGTTLSNQYAAMGAVFSPNAFTGAGGPSGQDWATNTDMTITSIDTGDVGGLGTPSLVSGNVLHSFGGWLNEDGDGSFSIDFSTPVNSVSMDFAGVATPADVQLFAYNGATLLGTVAGTVTTGQFTLSFAAASITSVAVTPGSFDDWVGVDNVVFAPVPEPASYLLMGLGLATLLAFRHRSRT
ncbi:MAG: PEP-CTERM sorting domain-containing protein [Pseudomonadota bacterium]|nr:PEP-CTERM sorting domain-containing protein [Pseudomonadota bacterium]